MPFYADLKLIDNENAPQRLKKQRVAANLRKLKNVISRHISQSRTECEQKHSVRIATWNLRAFGNNTKGGRDFESIYYIAEIISHFHIVALQEICGDLTEFKHLMRVLGPDWNYIGSDVTDGNPGNGERMVFLFNERHVQFRNIAGELTLKEGNKIRAAFGERIKLTNDMQIRLAPQAESLSGKYKARLRTDSGGIKKLNADLEIPLPSNSVLELPDGASLVVPKNTPVVSPGRGLAKVTIPHKIGGQNYRLRFPENSFDDSLQQFARTPYLLSFQAGWLKLNLCTVHILYGDSSDVNKLEQRRSEIAQLTQALAHKAKEEFKLDDKAFLGVLGDFNIIGAGHPTMSALESNGFVIPERLKAIPGTNVARNKAYDQIAFWKPYRIMGYARLDILAAGVFDFFEHVFRKEDEAIYRAETDNGLTPTTGYGPWRTYKMSDHLPMWIELRTDFSAEYLQEISDSP